MFMWFHFYRFTLTAQSLFQIKRQLDKLGELILKVTYESDPIPLQRPQMEEQVKYLIYHLIKRYNLGNTLHLFTTKAQQFTSGIKTLNSMNENNRKDVLDDQDLDNLSWSCLQLLCGGEAALHAYTPSETSNHQNTGAVYHQGQVWTTASSKLFM